MASALVEVCVDPRINHEVIRIQVRQRLERSGIRAERIYILNDVGGNPGSNFRNTIQLLSRMSEPIVFCAVLHHTDCLSAQSGLRSDLAVAAQQMAAELSDANAHVPVLTGQIRTENNELLWSDEPVWRYVPFTFGAGDPVSRRGPSWSP
jgi:hypothetical protein